MKVEPSANGVAVEEVTVLRPYPVVGTTVSADAKLPIPNMAARARTDVFSNFIISSKNWLVLNNINLCFGRLIVEDL